eukprot:SM002552S09019  [mRNA]  locus=s2552:940:1627:- [translate_table: standard]
MQAILWTVAIWAEIPAAIIQNCWKKAAILPKWDQDSAMLDHDQLEPYDEAADLQELDRDIADLKLGPNGLSAEEYLNLPGEDEVEAPSTLTDEQIVSQILPSTSNDGEDDDSDDPPSRWTTHNEATVLIGQVGRYLAQGMHRFTQQDILMCERWQNMAVNDVVLHMLSRKQAKISTYMFAERIDDK